MPKAVVKATFEELKERGDRAITRAAEAVRGLRIAARESKELRSLIDRIHHQDKPASARRLDFR